MCVIAHAPVAIIVVSCAFPDIVPIINSMVYSTHFNCYY